MARLAGNTCSTPTATAGSPNPMPISERSAEAIISDEQAAWWNKHCGVVLVMHGRYFLVSDVSMKRRELYEVRDDLSGRIIAIQYSGDCDVGVTIRELFEAEAEPYTKVYMTGKELGNGNISAFLR